MAFSRIFPSRSTHGAYTRSQANSARRLTISYRIFSPVWLIPISYVSGNARASVTAASERFLRVTLRSIPT